MVLHGMPANQEIETFVFDGRQIDVVELRTIGEEGVAAGSDEEIDGYDLYEGDDHLNEGEMILIRPTSAKEVGAFLEEIEAY